MQPPVWSSESESLLEKSYSSDMSSSSGDLVRHCEGLSRQCAHEAGPFIRSFFTFRLLKRALVFLLPSPLQRCSHSASPATSRTINQTATSPGENLGHLDALRGLACLCVVNQHFTTAMTRTFYTAWGGPCVGPICPVPNRYVVQLPYVNLLWNGHAMVAIFFVISGHVLSYKPLKLIRSLQQRQRSQGENQDPLRTELSAMVHWRSPSTMGSATPASTLSWHKVLVSLSSSVFRRIFRLYIPVAASTFLVALASYLGLFDASRRLQEQFYLTLITSPEIAPPRFDTLSSQLSQWFSVLISQFRDPRGFVNELDRHTWTIPIEVRSSMTLFVVLTGLIRLRFVWRMTWLVMLVTWAIYWVEEGDMLFLCGLGLADVYLHLERFGETSIAQQRMRSDEEQAASPDIIELQGPHGHARNSETISLRSKTMGMATGMSRDMCCIRPSTIAWLSMLLIGGYLSSFPYETPDNTPGFIWLARMVPSHWVGRQFWKNIGAVVIVYAVGRWERLRRYLTEGALFQYIGKVRSPLSCEVPQLVCPPFDEKLAGSRWVKLGLRRLTSRVFNAALFRVIFSSRSRHPLCRIYDHSENHGDDWRTRNNGWILHRLDGNGPGSWPGDLVFERLILEAS